MMVRALHAASLEVILDVVYNHTAEGNHLGPTLSLRGIDNSSYYRLLPNNPRYYQDFTGCGNTLNMRSPRVLQLIMDSLRYWVLEMHVDGFRFDLASALARELHAVDKLGAFFDIIHQDPVLSQVKLIAEPWDLGEGGYQVGNFPTKWTEWNGKYRDAVRRFWRGDGGVGVGAGDAVVGQQRPVRAERTPAVCEHQLHHRARRLHAGRSRQLQRQAQRRERRAQPGRREPQSELELRRRGADRRSAHPRSARPPAAELHGDAAAVSVGVPMISGGDEMGRTQAGNNNAYCQDNEISWTDWTMPATQRDFLSFVRQADSHPQGSPGAAPAEVLPGPADPRRGRAGHRLARPGRAAR